MKTIQELRHIQKETLKKLNLEEKATAARVIVGMSTCGISAGATPVYQALLKEVQEKAPASEVSKAGCIGICCMEPIVEVFEPGEEKVTYVMMTAEKVARVVEEHLVHHKVVKEYTIGAAQ